MIYNNMGKGMSVPNSDKNPRFRGADLTEWGPVEVAQRIANNFDNLYIGDYFKVIINTEFKADEEVILVISDFNPLLGYSNVEITTPHVGLITKNLMATKHRINSTDTANGAFKSSEMRTVTLPKYAAAFETALQGHLMPFNELVSTKINTSGYSMAGGNFKGSSDTSEWIENTKITLPSESQVHGSKFFSSAGYDGSSNNDQLMLFRLSPGHKIGRWYDESAGVWGRSWYWEKDVCSSSGWCRCDSYGSAYYTAPSSVGGLRPLLYLSS